MKNTKIIALSLLLTCPIIYSCSDNILSEITTLETSRAFSPTDLDARVTDKTNVRLAWKAKENTKYTIEIFDNAEFSGLAEITETDILPANVPYTVKGLRGDTNYYVRVKAVQGDIEDSKWVTATFKTDPEQIFNPVVLENITAKSVILTWKAEEKVTSIVLTPGNITHTVTPQEIAVGSALIEGLSPETTYIAKLLNGAATRGTVSFTTGIDIGDAILITNITELKDAIANSVGGESLALVKGEYLFEASTSGNPVNVDITKPISIVAAKASERPILRNVSFNVKQGASFKLKDLVVDGSNNAGNLVVYSAGAYDKLEVEGCLVENFKSGIIYNNDNVAPYCKINTVMFNNNVFQNFGTSGEFIDFRYGYPVELAFTNNTVSGQAERDFIRIDAIAALGYPASGVKINVSNNTLYGVANYASSVRRLFYVRIPAASHTISFTKNIVAQTSALLANQAATNLVTLSKNNYFNTTNLVSSSVSGAKVDASGTTLDPGFASPSTGNFKISNSDLISDGIGDPRWR